LILTENAGLGPAFIYERRVAPFVLKRIWFKRIWFKRIWI